MDVLKYLPRGLVHSWVLKKKERSGLNRARARRLDERHNEMSALETNVKLVYDNAELETLNSELGEKYEKLVGTIGEAVVDARNTLEELTDLKKTALYLMMFGPASKLGYLDEHEKSVIDRVVDGRVNETLVKNNLELKAEIGNVTEERNVLKSESFAYKIGDTCAEKGVDRVPAFGYANGKIRFTTPNLDKHYGSRYSMEMVLDKDEKLQAALKKGKSISRVYDDKNIMIIFQPDKELRKRGEDFAAASIIPLKHGKRARKVFEKRGEIAREEINKSAEFLHRSGLYFKKYGKE